MVKVTYNGTVLAESNDTVIVEGNHYFPPSSVKTDLFTKSPTKTVCPWKGTAWYYTLKVDGTEIKDVAW
ncbi:hypothetical protein AX14_001780 [Amanita brunnescens Koide BX004]|nr:hypothetical protein AX14_001780 [Amanita brunnescens Koide BX004]